MNNIFTTEPGGWTINVTPGALPEKVATAFAELDLFGAEYTPLAYLGFQVVNGINHAVLAEQLIVTGKDTKNVVLVILNEKDDQFVLAGIERVLVSGAGEGGVVVDPDLEIPEEAEDAFENAIGGFVGSAVEPFAYLGSQVVKGVDYFLAAQTTMLTAEAATGVAMVVVESDTNKVEFVQIL